VTGMKDSAPAPADGALAAYGTVGYGETGDSMRWRPEPPALVICDGGRLLTPARRSPSFAEAEIIAPAAWFSGNWEAFGAEVDRAVREVHSLYAAWKPRHHKRRCSRCNPAGNPGPLAVDGHEYQRRLKNRRKRK